MATFTRNRRGRRLVARLGLVGAERGLEIAAYVVGPGHGHTDLYEDWARLSEISEDGVVLVRPDAHVAWRSITVVDDATAALDDALRAVLARPRSRDAAENVGALAQA
ncbi:aromatic-ring hydroxylase C-terminal domain-containing protein [Georgenia ruanii]|uniref:aromatic-ring hydroxylase C-terminal domain-containing protein n=1 Tax=Georgenia ruanii TaxID=348442 RepID=UPI001264A856|nr:hypothetical protein [Georgenia ruanii]